MHVLTLVPVHNEERTVNAVLDRLGAISRTIVCLCDGNTDGTDDIVRKWVRGGEGRVMLSWDKNIGAGGALRLGLEYAHELLQSGVMDEADMVCTIDADGQHDPEDLRGLIAIAERTDFDVVQGIRSVISLKRLRLAGNRVLNFYARLLTGHRYADVECGMRCVSMRLVPGILQYFEGNSYGVGQEMAGAFRAIGAKVYNGAYIRPGPMIHRTKARHFFFALGCGLAAKLRALIGAPLPERRRRPEGFQRLGSPAWGISACGKRPALAYLVVTPTGDYVREDRCQASLKHMFVPFFREPIDLLTIASAICTKGGFAVVRDFPAMGLGQSRFYEDIASLRPNFLVVSTTDFTVKKDLSLAQEAKRRIPGLVTVFKGPTFRDVHRSEDLCRAFPAVDVLARNDYVRSIAQVVSGKSLRDVPCITYRDATTGRLVSNGDTGAGGSAQFTWSHPMRYLSTSSLYRRPDNGRPLATVEVSRGCNHRCLFCLAPYLHPSAVAFKEPKMIVEEVAEAVESYGLRDFFFLADCFTQNRPWVREICDRIMRRGLRISWISNSRIDTLDENVVKSMAMAGCRGIALGIESGSQATIDRLRKYIQLKDVPAKVRLLRDRGIMALGYFMIGFPWEDEELIKKTIRFACSLGLSLAEFNMAIPFPSTPLHDICKREHLIECDDLDSKCYGSPVVRTRHLSSADLARLRKKAYYAFYGRPTFLARSVAANLSLTGLLRLSWYCSRKFLWLQTG